MNNMRVLIAEGHMVMGTRPDAAAELIVRGIERRSPRVLIGRDAKQAEFIQRLFPVHYFAMLKKLAGA